MKKLNIAVLLVFLILNTAKAQDVCIIRGKITDEETGEPLIGALIKTKNTNPAVVTVSDFDGNFSLENVPTDVKEITISFLSYQTKIINNLNLPTGGIKIINLMLSKAASEISEVLVSAERLTNTEAAILNYRKKASGAVNGISSEQISKNGDSNAATALKRVTGISISEGKYVFVRGLSDRYSLITLNGSEIPGLDPDKNTVQTDMFPSNIIDNINVHKSFTPDLPASFTGGYVNINTKKYPEKFTLTFSSAFGYNPQTNLKNILSYKGGKYDNFGFDDGTRNIPETVRENIPALYVNNNELDKITASFNKTMNTTYEKSFLNHSHSVSVGNRIKLFGKDFGFILSGSYKRNFMSYENGIYGRYNLVESAEGGIMNPLVSEKETKGEMEAISSLLAGLSCKLNRNNSIGLTVLAALSGLKSARYREGQKTEDNIYMFEHVLGFQERKLVSGQISGKHILQNLSKLKIEWISSLTFSGQKEPDLRFFNYDKENEKYQISYNAYPSPARFYGNLSEINSDSKIHFSFPSNLFGKKIKYKTGGAFTVKSRNSNSTKFDILSQGLDFDGNIELYLSDENIGQNAKNAVYGIYVSNDPLTDAYNSYYAEEYTLAGYAEYDIEISKNFKMLAGIRYEGDYTFMENDISRSHYKYVRAEQFYPDFLPAVNLKYSFGKKTVIRLIYAETVARPSFKETAPYAYYDFKEGWRVVGNPELKRTLTDNVDLRFDFFGQKNDIFSVNLFYKYFVDPIELIDDPRANNPEFHYVNADNSMMFGFETEIKKNLSEIGLPHFSTGGNFTLLNSQVEYINDYGSEEQSSISVKRPMYGQAPWVVNLFLNYDNSEKGISFNLIFNAEGNKLAVVTKGNTPNIYKKSYPDLKFNISKKAGKHFNLKFSINNILNKNHEKTYTYQGKDYIFQSFKTGRIFSFALTYNL